MTTDQLTLDAVSAMAFLRASGSRDGAKQAEAIQRLITRLRSYEAILAHQHVATLEAWEHSRTYNVTSDQRIDHKVAKTRAGYPTPPPPANQLPQWNGKL